MRWHLCNPTGVSMHVCDAPDKSTATTIFGKLAPGWFVTSDASYRIGFPAFDVPALCGKCFRHTPMEGHTKCQYCRELHRSSTNRASTKRRARERDLRHTPPSEPVYSTGQIAKLFGVSTNRAHSIMIRDGYHPVDGFAKRVGRAGRAERQWLQSDVKRVKSARRLRNIRAAALRREYERRFTKRQEVTT